MQRIASIEIVVRLLLVFTVIVLIFIASQIFWIRRVRELSGRLISNETWRRGLGVAAAVAYVFLFASNFPGVRRNPSPTSLTLPAALLEAPFTCWAVCSVLGFAVAMFFWIVDRLLRAVRWIYRKMTSPVAPEPSPLASPGRRRFLEQTAWAASATPFIAGAYGFFYGRLNLETTRERVRLRGLPKAFEGFRIAQLSDIHIGPFMSAEEIRKYVGITNDLKPELVVLTGDFVTWDPTTQGAVVKALAGLRAPSGVFGCLGNHELWTETEHSITHLFAVEGIQILRQARAPIERQGEMLNLIGVDFQTRTPGGSRHGEGFVRGYLEGVERLVLPDTVNILLSHNPNTFDRAADLGIDLSLAGHTHGGQVTLEFMHRNLSPGRLVTPYVRGWFQKTGAQLYVNRGIGTIGAPIRLNATPEITVFELTGEAS